jgi:hypothetical protein
MGYVIGSVEVKDPWEPRPWLWCALTPQRESLKRTSIPHSGGIHARPVVGKKSSEVEKVLQLREPLGWLLSLPTLERPGLVSDAKNQNIPSLRLSRCSKFLLF